MNDKNKTQQDEDMKKSNVQGEKGGTSEVTSDDLNNAADTLDFNNDATSSIKETTDIEKNDDTE